MKTGIELIAAERERQITAEGWSAAHDDEHDCMELASAAACYLDYYIDGQNEHSEDEFCPRWPWDQETWKPSAGEGANFKIANLVKAGALIAAEIDRLQRTRQGSTPTLDAIRDAAKDSCENDAIHATQPADSGQPSTQDNGAG